MNFESTETSAHSLMKERKQLFVDAVRQEKKPKRVPILANTWTWKICDSPYKFSEAIYDYDIMYKIVCDHHEKYDFDLYSEDGGRNKLLLTDVFGKDCCYIIDDKNYGINYPDTASIADEEDYPAFLEKGLVKYYFENAICRKYGLTDAQDAISRFGPAALEFVKMNEFSARVKKQFNEVYGVPDWSPIFPEFPCDTLFKAVRGMKGFSIDLRRNTRYVEQSLEMIDDYFFPPLKKRLEKCKEMDSVVFSGGRGTSLVHTVLNPKQFEKYHWPYIKRYVDLVAKNDLTCTLFMEGSIELLYDYLQDIPKGHVGLVIEQDDPVKVKEKLPNITVVGGFPTHYLGKESVEKCLDKAKEIIDKMAYDGNYIFTSDKMLSYPSDARTENFKALNKFLKEYAVF
ncbi:MAG: uroporphyrinogen decarboxylase family protein [Eubacteriales bacterium]